MTDTSFWDFDVPTQEHIGRAMKLAAHCRAFIEAQSIGCVETIYQTDRVVENSLEFIEGVCKIAGYAPRDRDDDE